MADLITLKRWNVIIDYRHDDGIRPRQIAIEELHELHDIIERGPNFYAIDKITIRPGGGVPLTTVEQGNVA